MMPLPSGWTLRSIDQLISLNPKTDAPTDTNAGFSPMQALGKRFLAPLAFELRPWGEIKKAYTHFANGDVLLAKITPCFENGKAGIARNLPNGIGAGSSEFFVCRPKDLLVDARYLLAWFSTDSFRIRGAVNMTGSVGHKRVPKDFVLGDIIPLAPFAEQKRIADKLDIVFARVDACSVRLAGVAPLLKRFRQSVLAAATSGELTKDWRVGGSPVWETKPLDSLCLAVSDGPFGSHLKSDDYVSEGVRVVRLENIGHLNFDRTKDTYISADKYKTLLRHTLVSGDLLFSSFVDEEVRICEFPGDLGVPAINKADCFCLRVDSTVCDRRFLAFRLACKTTYEALKAKVHGATRPRINLRQLRSFEVKLPSMAEQAEIVRRVEKLFAFADRLEARLSQAQTAVDRLTPALLAKAFRGELVPQDPADEAAGALLQRIAAQPAEAPARRGRPRRAASVA